MHLRRDPLPSEHHNPYEARLQHEGHSGFISQHVSEEIASSTGEGAPVCPELKLQGNTRGHTEGNIEKEKTAPETCVAIVLLIFRPYPAGFKEYQKETHADCCNRPEDMEHCREGELHPRECNSIRKAIHRKVLFLIFQASFLKEVI